MAKDSRKERPKVVYLYVCLGMDAFLNTYTVGHRYHPPRILRDSIFRSHLMQDGMQIILYLPRECEAQISWTHASRKHHE